MKQTTFFPSKTKGKKRLTFLSFLFLMLLLAGLTNKTQAQTTCAVATSIPITSSGIGNVNNVLLTDSVYWYSFVATDNSGYVIVSNPQDALPTKISTVYLYSGTCGSLIAFDSAQVNPFNKNVTLYIPNLTIGTTYFIKALRDVKNCDFCRFTNRKFSISIQQYNATASSCSATPCDYVFNGEFNQYNNCPNGAGEIDKSCSWTSPTPVGGGQPLYADYFNSCCSYNPLDPNNTANTGVPSNFGGTSLAYPTGNTAYAGLTAYYANASSANAREYIQEQLNGTLTALHTYQVSMWVSLAKNAGYSVNNLGIFLSNFAPQQTSVSYLSSYIPQINNTGSQLNSYGWTKISGIYTSSGGEDYITIGNFNDDLNSNPTLMPPLPPNGGGGNPPLNPGTPAVTAGEAYYYIDDVSIIEIPTLTVSAAQPKICTGSSTTLTASGADTYSWSTGATTNPIAVSPTTTTTYTVTGTNTSGTPTCISTASATVKVTVEPLPTVMITANPQVICPGSSKILTASGASTYSWSPATGLSSTTSATVTATPAGTTTYTVTGTNANGCTNSAIATVTVNPPPTVTATAALLTICSESSTPLTASGANTYSWSPAGGLSSTTSATPIATPTTTTTYTVTGTNNHGCTNTATVTVTVSPTCCTDANGNTYSSPFATTIYGGTSYTMSSATAAISGTFTINHNFTIAGCDVAMAAGAEIDVQAPNTLTITLGRGGISRLYACGNMWQGIVVEPGAFLVINGGSYVEDAIEGIEGKSTSSPALAGNISVISSTLNNNYQDIVIDPYSNVPVYPLTLEKNTFTCKVDGTYSGNAYLKTPYGGQLTYQGIYLNTVEVPVTPGNPAAPIITIGSTVPANTNDFSNMHYGVYALQSNFAVYNNNFTNLTGYPYYCSVFSPPCPVWGIAVFATTNLNSGNSSNGTLPDYNTYNTAIVGGANSSGATSSNTMTECYGAVSTQNYVYAKIMNNSISNATDNVAIGAPPVGSFGIQVQTLGYYGNVINNNTITNTHIGINVLRDYINFGELADNGTFIDSNNISAATTGNNTMSDGIYVQDANPRKPLDQFVKADFNTIENAYTCINMLDVNTVNLYINNNPTLHITPSVAGSSVQKAGIRLQGVDVNTGGFIQNNPDISAPGTYVANPLAPADTTVRGIFLTEAPQVTVTCNDINSVGQDMVFEANCNLASIYSNTMGKAYDQFVLLSNSMIGQQGNITQPIGDTWGIGTSGAAVRSQTYTYNTTNPALNAQLWVAAGTTTTPANNQTNSLFPNSDSYNELGALNTAATGALALACKKTTVLTTSTLLDRIATDSVHYLVLIPQTQYINKAMLFRQLAQNDSLMLSDTVLQNFYTSTKSSSTGTLYAVDTLMGTGNITAASALNSAIAPVNNIEQNQQDVNAVYMSTLAIGHDTLNVAQYNTLNAVAVQCPVMGGMSVYRARVMLNWMLDTVIEYTDNCGSAAPELLHRPTKIQASNLNANVYPNPANSLLNVAVNMSQIKSGSICLYSATGEEVMCEDLTGNITSIAINNLPAGLYYYRITDVNGSLVKSDKVVIVK